MREDRTPCINPRCRRTFKRDNDAEIVCGKCFKMLPHATRAEHRGYWRKIRMWERRVTRTSDEMKITRMHAIRDLISERLGRHWDSDIKSFFVAPVKPEGLDAFLEEVGL